MRRGCGACRAGDGLCGGVDVRRERACGTGGVRCGIAAHRGGDNGDNDDDSEGDAEAGATSEAIR